tara:strand:+ start:1264 stop:1896 length:633 start_codon:yes stop_codon:yes gene_type:complete
VIKSFQLEKPNLSPNFIGSWIIDDSLCDELVVHFENNQSKLQRGAVGSNASIKLEAKNRMDLRISPKEINLSENKVFKIYFNDLFECYKDFSNTWPHLKTIARNLDIPSFNIGRYETGQHYQAIHCERAGLGTLHRLFAFMTYLNNVEEGGNTYFDNYDLEIQPKKGLTLIWPAEWTHTHRGNKVIKGTKYMITGHLCFGVDETQKNFQN